MSGTTRLPAVVDESVLALLETSSDALFMVAEDRRVLDFNSRASELFGYSAERFRTMRWDELVVPDARLQAALEQREREPAARVQARVTWQREDASQFEGELIDVRGGSVDAVSWRWLVVRDLSERLCMEQTIAQLRDAAELLRALSDAAFEGVFMHSDGIIRHANRAAELYAGVSPGELTGRRLFDFIAPESRAMVADKVAAADELPYQAYAMRVDGSTYPVEVHPRIVPIEIGCGSLRVVAMRDMSSRLELEQQLRQSQKMEAIGRLAAGVAHDFNNLLSVMLGATELATADLAEDLAEDHPARGELRTVIDTATRATELTRQLLAAGRRAPLQPEIIDAGRSLVGMRSLLGRLLDSRIELSFDLPSEPTWLRVDPRQLEQIMLNLVINARDAMPEGGRLRIGVEAIEVDASLTRTHLELQPGRYVQITVADTGIGMDAETRARMFEPFFTTKTARRGSGLGLATVFGIITQSGGTILVESACGQGTTLTILLPASAEGPAPQLAHTPTAAAPDRLTILVVEDEAAIRRVVVDMLGRAGYRVLEAADPIAALELARAQHGQVDLLLTDVIMPHMSGMQLAQRITADDEQVRVLFMSGYAAPLEPGAYFIAKPIKATTLLAAVADACKLS